MKNNFKYLMLIVLLVATKTILAQLSPGDLSSSHAHLEGIKNCTQCHVLGKKETTSKCLACHIEIKDLINKNKGYHASSEVKGKKCAACHGEHYGRDFKINQFDTIRFNHQLSGYQLKGKHTEINCAQCHKKDFILERSSQKKGHTFLGLGTECLSCHSDYHQNTLPSNCTKCHNQNSFTPADGFNHNQTNFALEGKHKNLECISCHKKDFQNGTEFQHFTGINHKNCTDCHKDVHNAKFGTDCQKCHTVFSFHEVKNLSAFNHQKTNFPLTGLHQAVACKKCHTGNYTLPVKHNSCFDCHADYHKSQFEKNGVIPDCSECHSTKGYTPSKFTLEKHNQQNFVLEGAHAATPCFSCHKKNKEWSFKFKSSDCITCHENIHQNYLAEKFVENNNCKSCHSISVWNEIHFDHQQTKFELKGKHRDVSCRKCHFFKNEKGQQRQQYSGLAETCENCHTDIHYNQFEEENKNYCDRCHNFQNWKPVKFDHAKARFKLDGKHESLACKACHKAATGFKENYIVYKFKSIKCESCH